MRLPKPGEGGGDFAPVPVGTHVGVCSRFIDLGTQQGTFQGKATVSHKVMITWEIAAERMSDGRPFTISKRYTWSMHEKASLRKDLEAWRGKAFTDDDFEGPNAFNTRKLLGQPCMLTVTHETSDGKTYANIAGVGKIMKGLTPESLTNEIVYFSMDGNEFDQATYVKLSDGLKEVIAKSPEYAALKSPRSGAQQPAPVGLGADIDDDIPF